MASYAIIFGQAFSCVKIALFFSNKFICSRYDKYCVFIAAKYEAYELISGYDKNKGYDNKILKTT